MLWVLVQGRDGSVSASGVPIRAARDTASPGCSAPLPALSTGAAGAAGTYRPLLHIPGDGDSLSAPQLRGEASSCFTI